MAVSGSIESLESRHDFAAPRPRRLAGKEETGWESISEMMVTQRDKMTFLQWESVLSFSVANLSTPNFQTKVLFGESRQTTNPALKQSRGSFPDQNFISIDPDSMFQKSTICNYRLLCDDYDDGDE